MTSSTGTSSSARPDPVRSVRNADAMRMSLLASTEQHERTWTRPRIVPTTSSTSGATTIAASRSFMPRLYVASRTWTRSPGTGSLRDVGVVEEEHR